MKTLFFVLLLTLGATGLWTAAAIAPAQAQSAEDATA